MLLGKVCYAPIVDMVEVCRACDPGSKGTLDASVPLDEAAHIISVLAVPLTPYIPVGKAPHLVQTTTVPGLCYELYLQQWQQRRHSSIKHSSLLQGSKQMWSI